MATEPEKATAHPGDIIQDQSGQIMLVVQTQSWGVGAVQRWHDGIEMRERYYRLKREDFVICGAAQIMPAEVAQLRRDSLTLAAQIASEAGQ